jgi:hypothetical protein
MAFAAVVVFPGLGGFGFWDPWELGVADRAREVAASPSLFDATAGGRYAKEPPLDLALAALGMKTLGLGELGARLGNGLLAVLALLATYWAATGLLRRRAALFSVLALGTMPLFFQQARQVTSDMGLVLGLGLACGGLARFTWPAHGRRRPVDLLMAFVGMAFGTFSGGALMAVALPCLTLAGAIAVGWSLVPARTGDAPGPDPLADPGAGPHVPGDRPFGSALFRGRGGVVVALVVALGLTVLIVTLTTANVAGTFSLWLGGTPRGGTPTQLFIYFVEQLGFGLFPWSALLVFALGRALASTGDEGAQPARLAFVQTYLLLFAAFAFGLGSLFVLMTGNARFPALVPLALALGAFLDEASDRATAGRPEPVLGLVAGIGTVVVARDLLLAPEALVSVHLLDTVKWPPTLKLGPLFLVFGVLFAGGLYLALATRAAAVPAPPEGASRWGRHYARAARVVITVGRHGVTIAVAAAILFSLTVTQFVFPALSKHFSPKTVFQSFSRHSRPGDEIGRYRVEGQGATFYGAGAMVDIPSQDRLMEFFRREKRVFCLIAREDLAALDAAFKTATVNYAVVDSSSSRFLLLANKLESGQEDQNPLKRDVWMAPRPPVATSLPGSTQVTYEWGPEKPPWQWQTPLNFTFQDSIELVGATYPSSIRRPAKFGLTLYFRVNKQPPPGYKLFVHLDIPGHPRLIGDHDLLGGAFPTSYWLPGEYIRDHHEIDVPLMTTPAGNYTLLIGFWPGGESRRLSITQGPNDGADRALLGTVRIR